MKILVIEDDEAIRRTLRDILEVNGHGVLSAEDGPSGLRLAAERPDLIFCDIGLPGIDGHEVMRRLSQQTECRDIPFIFLTARAERSSQRRGMAQGADDYITKPFTESDILEAIAARVQRQRPWRERLEALMQLRNREVTAEWAHELMTPLNGILGGLGLIESEAGRLSVDELKEALALIRTSAIRQYRLARKLISYFELEQLAAGKGQGAQSCHVEAAAGCGAARAGQEEDRERDLSVACEPATVPLAEGRLMNAVGELVENGLRFSRPGEPVMVTGRIRGDRYRLEVIDRGPGIPPERRERIGPFVQFDRERNEQQGLGLGLAIARACAASAGGALTLEDGPGGVGLKAVLEMPLATDAPASGDLDSAG